MTITGPWSEPDAAGCYREPIVTAPAFANLLTK
jgi:hypothetical protein